MATIVLLLLTCSVPIVASLILPMRQSNGTSDIDSVINHVTLMGQQIEALQNALQNQIQTSSSNMNILMTKLTETTVELHSADDRIKELQKQVDILQNAQQSQTQTSNYTIEMLHKMSILQDTLHDQIQTSNDTIERLQKQVTALSQNKDLRVAFQTVLREADVTVEQQDNLKFNSTLNLGGGYNQDNGVFTVPISGVYIFWANIVSDDSIAFEIKLVKEGENLVGGYSGRTVSSSQFYSGTASFVFMSECQKGETVIFRNNLFKFKLDGHRFSTYGGVLIG